ncbi:glycosyltransferase family 4 protein [Thomasclavelia ramosa]|uniref:glycosyltransferase family 4 protein n=1 Tax=Thomasclavelia ramosa TaxID=1547 RepID=UPI000E3FDFE3|nr:glycosyltransferase [Thomasclavelia ramosa]RGC88098.1 glycosyltransferase family 1 protein [Thomasclavelia ramosa]
MIKSIKQKILIIGAFAFDTGDTGGQPVKTRELFYALQNKYGEDNIDYIETIGWKKHPISLFFTCLIKAKNADVIIMLPAHNGLLIFSRLLYFFKKRYKKKIYYDVVGGWLAEKINEVPKLIKYLREFDSIWVETTTMYKNLNILGFKNVVVVPNFKKLIPLTENEMIIQNNKPLKLCTFSRVMKEKGIEDLITAINIINTHEIKYKLDIYGPVDASYKDKLNKLLLTSNNCARYCGIKDPKDSVKTLKNYFALVFPTRFYTEGIPGTIIDAYYAGVPVIASKWESFADVIDDNITGIGYEFGDIGELVSVLSDIANNPNLINKLKKNCINKSFEYTPEFALELMKIGEENDL